MNKKMIAILAGIILVILSLNSVARPCPPEYDIRNKATEWIYAIKWNDGRWVFLSDTFYYNNELWNIDFLLKLPNINDTRTAMAEASKKIKTLPLNDARDDISICRYAPKGADYSVEAHSPPEGP